MTKVSTALTTKNLKLIPSPDFKDCGSPDFKDREKQKLFGVGCFQVLKFVAQELNWRISNDFHVGFLLEWYQSSPARAEIQP